MDPVKVVRIIGPRDPPDPRAINTTSRSRTWSRGLSPFLLGPVPLPPEARERTGLTEASCVENLWQNSKLYALHMGPDGRPTDDYWRWAAAGWAGPPQRYPMGKGAAPVCGWWDGRRLTYVEARAAVYVPAYARAVLGSPAWARLAEAYRREEGLVLWDFDPFDYTALGMSFKEAVRDPSRPLGHAAVLKWLLEAGV